MCIIANKLRFTHTGLKSSSGFFWVDDARVIAALQPLCMVTHFQGYD